MKLIALFYRACHPCKLATSLGVSNYVTEALGNACKAAGVKRVRFHALRHTHLSLLLRSGVPVHAVAARAGHARASTTLDTYAHLLGGEDGHAAAIADAILSKAIK